MRRAIRPATCTQVRSWPSSRWIHRALRSFAVEALSSAALTKAPPKYQRSFTMPSTGARLECTLNTFMKTLTLSASRLRYGSWLRLTSTMRPSAGESTAAGSSGASRGGSRKNCRMKTVPSHSGSDHQPSHHVASTDTASAARRKGQPSRAMIGCGQGGVTRYRAPQFREVSTRRFFLIQGIISRSRAPTFSIGSSAVMRLRESSVGAPARFSSTNYLAYSPDWMRYRISFMRLLLPSSMILGPETYSPYSALFEIE